MARMRSAPALAAPSASAIHAHAARCRPLGSARSAGTSGAVRSAVTGSGHPAAAISPARTATVTTAKPARTHLPPSCLRLRGGAGDPELLENGAGGAQLTKPAVDHQQVGQAAVLARVAEAPADHLGHRGEIVGPLDRADAVVAVARLGWCPFVEGDDRPDGLPALEGR